MSVKTPVRIYTLWHEDFTDGLPLARHIYHWFRLSTGEGIPVYFRTSPPKDARDLGIDDRSCDLNIIVPLVESHMVASLPWRRHVEALTRKAIDEPEPGKAKYEILPVALHTNAYQMPSMVKRLNFIRHLDMKTGKDDDVLLTKLTEAFCLLLREQVIGKQSQPIKIFLSHAKADGTYVPKAIKNFIQTETQCHTFFDENDISYGQDFSDVIEDAIETESAGLLVIQGDNYADRPWCRKEIRDFLKPHKMEDQPSDRGVLFSVMPAVVVTNFEGVKTARTIPELGHASCLQWTGGAARSAVVTMLREILFSTFYRLLARATTKTLPDSADAFNLLVNRPPDPVMVEHLCRQAGVSHGAQNRICIYHPGHGLTGVERKGLRAIYDGNVEFTAFGEAYDAELCTEIGTDVSDDDAFTGEVLAISVSESPDIVEAGISDDHTVELLRAILRPAFKQGMSLLYGGKMNGFSGIMPGVWEEILHAFDAGRPAFIVGACKGAAGRIAQWLEEPPQTRPEELTFDYFVRESNDPDAMTRLGKDIESATPDEAPDKQLRRLWEYIDPSSERVIPNNGLEAEENKALFNSQHFGTIAGLVGKGLCELKKQKIDQGSSTAAPE